MCNCLSYNLDNPGEKGKRPEVVLSPPESLGITDFEGKPKENICIDYCIADVIKHLWDNSILTWGCCCGHNKQRPSVIIRQSADEVLAKRVRRLIAEVDNRDWEVLCWMLVEV